MTPTPRQIIFKVGALCGHKDAAAFADFVLGPPCAHEETFADEEPCPPPCSRGHLRCSKCWCPVNRDCDLLSDEDYEP